MLAFHIPHVQILGKNHCVNSCLNAFKHRELFQDVICCRDYAESVVASFSHQIQSEYYGGTRSVSIEGIVLEYFSALPQTGINSYTKPCSCYAVFHYFLSDDIKQYGATSTAHRKRFIVLLKEQKVLTPLLSTIWENTDGCAEQYRCSSEIYLMSGMLQC